jgi:putative transferase (TIGR04331 family)
MFLCISSNVKDWDLNKKLLLLGPWCINNKDDLSKLNYELLPYHCKDDAKLIKDLKYLFELYKDIIPEISKILNQKNKKEFSSKYWELLIGPWLWEFMQLLFDRYSSILQATNKYRNLETKITNTFYSPKTYIEYGYLVQDDDYNFIIYSKIIATLNLPIKISNKKIKIPSYKKDHTKSDKNIKIQLNLRFIKNFVRSSISNIINKILYLFFKIFKNNKDYFFDINLPGSPSQRKDLYKLLGANINIYKDWTIPKQLNHKASNIYFNFSPIIIKQKYKDDKFVKLLLDLLFSFMPTEYNLDFNLSRNHYIKFLSNYIPKIIGVRCHIEHNPVIRFCVAELGEKGTKILCCQEGGGDGAKLIDTIEDEFRTRVCDMFLSWGWENKNNNKIKKFYITKSFPRKYDYNLNGNIILLGASCRKYYFASNSGQRPSYNNTLMKYNINFIKNLNLDIYKKLIYRFHYDMGFNEQEIVKKRFPDLKFSTREETTYFYDLLFNSKLIVISTDYTTNKQAFVLNHPTILLWDNNYFKIRPEAKKYYDQLFDAGILYFSPESCAKKVNEIEKDPLKWWKSKKVQNAKNEYCNYLCRDTTNLPFKYSKLIKELSKSDIIF